MFRKTILTLMFLSIAVSAGAEWIDDWIQQKTYSGPAYLEGQKRGFASAGSMSLRWKHGVDYPVTIQKPRIKAGCGGIDLFLGGVSFLDSDYLVDKLESMISAAPAIAFQIALKTLSEQLATTLSEFTAIIDRLNQLQFDDCKATKAIITTAIDSYKAGEVRTEALADYSNSSGLTDLYKTFKNDTDGQTTSQAAGTVGTSEANLVSGCPATLRQIFFTDGYILDHLANSKGYSMDFAKLMRGFLGDVMVNISGGAIDYQYFGPCDNPPEHILDLILSNDLEYRNNAGTCVPLVNVVVEGNTYNSLNDWVYQMLYNIAQNIVTGTLLSAGQETFLNTIPIPVKKAIDNDLIVYGGNTAADFTLIADMYSRIVSISYAYAIIKDFYNQVHETLALVDTVIKNQAGAELDNCKAELARIPHDLLREMKQDLIKYVNMAQNDYSVQLADLIKHLEFADRVQESGKIVNDMLSAQIGNSSLLKRIGEK